MTAVVCARASARSGSTSASSWRLRSIAKSTRATAVSVTATTSVRTIMGRSSRGTRGSRGGRRIRSGSAASRASGSASATATIRLIQRICTGSTGRSGWPFSQRERQDRDRDDQRLPEARREDEAQRLDEVVVDAPALLDRGPQRAEVVVGEHHVGRLLGRGAAAAPHRHADVRLPQGGSVVDAVARHRDHLALRLQRADEAELVLGRHAGVDVGVPHPVAERVVVGRLELGSGDGSSPCEPERPSDRQRGARMVARDHHHADACLLARGDRAEGTVARRVDHGLQAQEAQTAERLLE